MSVLLASAAVSACTSSGSVVSPGLSASSATGYPPLPEAIFTIPNASSGADAGGSIAEASVVLAAKAPEGMKSEPAIAAGSPLAQADAAAQTEPTEREQDGQAVALDAAIMPAAFAGATPSQKVASIGVQPGAAAIGPILAPDARLGPDEVAARSPELDLLIAKYAKHYDVPEDLVRHVAKRESTLNPKARNGPYWGLMQISHPTARGMGYKGAPSGLLDAETNLKYAVRYLRGAWLVAKGNMALADRLYRRGYYYDAKRAGLLDETGLGKDRRRRRDTSS